MTVPPKLTKSGFLEWRDCSKSFWLSLRRPEVLVASAPSAFDRLLAADGDAVEEMARRLVSGGSDAADFRFQVVFDCGACHARADMVRYLADGRIDIFEIKSSTSAKSGKRDHRIDAAFQRVVAERAGLVVAGVYLIHLDGAYVRRGAVEPERLLVVADVTADVDGIREHIASEIEDALALLGADEIDEQGCSCRHAGSMTARCAAFGHLNPDIPAASAHVLPRISRARLQKLDQQGRLAIADVREADVTDAQLPVLRAFAAGRPVVDAPALEAFLEGLRYPIAYYDYEAFGSAIPAVDGVSPHQQIPFQFSVHVEHADGSLDHHEFLGDRAGMHESLVAALMRSIPATGTVVSWNAPYERACNARLAALLPHTEDFLADVDRRTVDLMLPFRDAYVDARFGGSTSIKNVLPVLAPDLSYGDGAVTDGAAAMEAWRMMLVDEDPEARAAKRRDLLAYCWLDSFAMVRIVQFLRRVAGA